MIETTTTTQIKVPARLKTQFVMKKNIEGSLTVVLETWDGTLQPKAFRFKANQDRCYVPKKYAIGAFINDSSLKQLELGYFTFEDLNELTEMAEKNGIYIPENIKKPVVNLKEMKQLLREGNVAKIKDFVINLSNKNKRDLISVARSNYATLNQGVISFLEKQLQVQISPVDISE